MKEIKIISVNLSDNQDLQELFNNMYLNNYCFISSFQTRDVYNVINNFVFEREKNVKENGKKVK